MFKWIAFQFGLACANRWFWKCVWTVGDCILYENKYRATPHLKNSTHRRKQNVQKQINSHSKFQIIFFRYFMGFSTQRLPSDLANSTSKSVKFMAHFSRWDSMPASLTQTNEHLKYRRQLRWWLGKKHFQHFAGSVSFHVQMMMARSVVAALAA